MRGDAILSDHPRVCGEQTDPLRKGQIRLGSPPRVRGTGGYRVGAIWSYRITPACAGNSDKSNIFIKKIWDHPRVCGEQEVSACP